MRLTERQIAGLRRLRKAENYATSLSPDLARQLIKKGLVTKLRTWQRYEWQRPVATLWVVQLTTAGQELCREQSAGKPLLDIL